ncbi:hypothetical protein Ddc_24779 [Ditylenchus destructor]|nr:hypothetical protein Ddc_24779 [Ditylenchus destructor]
MPEDDAAVQEVTRLGLDPTHPRPRSRPLCKQHHSTPSPTTKISMVRPIHMTKRTGAFAPSSSERPKASLLRARCRSESPRTASRTTTTIVTSAADSGTS